jgi:uncharacterized repeat protein (TIGR01451 family)
MRWLLRHAWPALLLTTGLSLLSGCLQTNPAYFPYYFHPALEVVQTHAKPGGSGYYANFDPYACRIEVRPLENSNPVGKQQVLIATIYDGAGQPRRARRVEWMLEGAGHIVEVDESGCGTARGYKVDNRYAVSYTDYFEHVITRGNDDPSDDFAIRPGQSWCVVSSPIEGDTHVTVYAPEIYNWDRHKVNVTVHWINAGWTMPQPAANRMGSQHVFTTNVFRYSDRMPLANYRVRYTILDGPPAVFLPGQQRVVEAVSDLQGNANATIVQTEPQGGVNRIGIEIIRPPDPCCPTGPGIIIGRGETYKEWAAPGLAIAKTGPPSAAVGQLFNYTITVTNTGRADTDALTVRDPLPEGLTLQNSQPPANVEGRTLVWTLAGLPPGRSAAIQATFRADRVGPVTNTVSVTSADGLRAETAATVQITSPGLNVALTGPPTGMVGVPVPYQVTVTNNGNGPASNVVLTAQFDDGLEHQTGANPLQLDVGTIGAGESKTYPMNLTPRRVGVLVNRVTATAEGGLTSAAQHAVTVAQPRLSVSMSGPGFKFARSQAEFNIAVTNPGDVPLSNVVVRNQLPPELSFVQGTGGAQPAGGNQVIWNLGTMQPQETRRLQLVTRAELVAPRAITTTTVTAEPAITERAEAAIEIRGAPALRLEALDVNDPIEVGQQTTYEISVTNTGTLPANGVQIICQVPPQMRARSGVGPGNTQPQIQDNRILFPAVDGLQPGQSQQYSVTVDALQPGDARFRIELRSTALGAVPVIEEESTTIFRPVETGTIPPVPAGPPPP